MRRGPRRPEAVAVAAAAVAERSLSNITKATMKALVLEQQGSLDQLKYAPDFPDPVVMEDHVVIRVKAASFNYHDVFTVRGMPGIKVPLPMIIGLDMAGEVLETGPSVNGLEIGGRGVVNPPNRQRSLMGGMVKCG